MLQIREALREMMENELIEIENKKLHKKLKSKQVTQPSTGRTSVNGPSPRSHSVELKMPDESKAVRNIKPSFSNKIKPKSDGKASPVISDTSSENGKTPRKPVLVTEVVKEEQDSQLILPAIREEKTQEEIYLGTPKSVRKDNGLRELPDTHISAAKERSSDSSFKEETQRKIDIAHSPKLDVVTVNTYKSPEPVKRKSPMPKRQSPLLKSRSPKPESQKASIKKQFDDNDANFKASTPKLPAIVIETATDEMETKQPTTEEVEAKQAMVKEIQPTQDMKILDSVRTEDDTPSPSLQPSMKFVNERIQDRYSIPFRKHHCFVCRFAVQGDSIVVDFILHRRPTNPLQTDYSLKAFCKGLSRSSFYIDKPHLVLFFISISSNFGTKSLQLGCTILELSEW